MSDNRIQYIKFARYERTGAHVAADVTIVQTLTIPTGTNAVMMQCSGADIRYTLDGTTPVAGTTGFVLVNGASPIIIDLPTNCTLKIISVSGTARIQYQFLR